MIKSQARFKGQAVIVTGAGSGIGRAAAAAFVREGARVLVAGRSASAAKAARELGAAHFTGDLSREDAAKTLIALCLKRFGRLDALVNAAGVARPGAIEDIALLQWREVFENNITNTFLCSREAIRAMKPRGGGAIVNVSSLAGRFRSGLGGAHYAASKAAVIGFTRHAAAEVAKHKIRVNAVCPGPTETPMLTSNAKLIGKELSAIRQAVPLGYISSPEEQAGPILFLASSESSYMTGAVLDVNGGIF